MSYCTRCILPSTRPNLGMGPDGVCNACSTHAARPSVDWAERRRAFQAVVAGAKKRARGHDCLVPVSGGKDSTWQVVTCLEHGLNPLAVTWKTPARTGIGQRNLDNLVGLGVDHIDYQVNPKVERAFLLASFERFGSTAIPMHLALFNIPLTIAARFRIPLVVWGENSATEYGGDEELQSHQLDARWLRTFGVTHGTTARDWVSETLTERALTPYFGPTDHELEAAGARAVFLGHYFPWDPETSLAVACAHGFRPRPEGPLTGHYDYSDIDDTFIAVHHWLKWYKFGFTRTWDNLALEIRNGRMSRDKAIEVLRERGDETPRDAIRAFCEFVGISGQRFFEVAERFRNPHVWARRDGRWEIPGFLVEGWDWT